jgi:hypothetical protein
MTPARSARIEPALCSPCAVALVRIGYYYSEINSRRYIQQACKVIAIQADCIAFFIRQVLKTLVVIRNLETCRCTAPGSEKYGVAWAMSRRPERIRIHAAIRFSQKAHRVTAGFNRILRGLVRHRITQCGQVESLTQYRHHVTLQYALDSLASLQHHFVGSFGQCCDKFRAHFQGSENRGRFCNGIVAIRAKPNGRGVAGFLWNIQIAGRVA